MPGRNKRHVSPVDDLWLHMDTPGNLMVIEGVMMFDEPLDIDRAIDVISMRLPSRYPVFRQIPVASPNPLAGDSWVDDPDFDISRHVVVRELDAPGDDVALQRYVSEQMSRPLDRSRPLWEIHFLTGYGAGTAIVQRYHHALADGTALARVLLELTDDRPDDDLAEAARIREEGADNVGPAHRLPAPGQFPGAVADAVVHGVGGTVARTWRGGLHAMSRLQALAGPALINDAMSLVRSAPEMIEKLFLADSPRGPLTGQVGIAKAAVWSRPHRLEEIKAAGRRTNATINDVMVAAVAGALRRQVIAAGGEPEDLATMVPVNLRPLDQPLPRELGNKFALVVLNLPVAGDSPRERLQQAKARMDAIKASPEAIVTFGVIETLGAISPQVARAMIDFFSAKAIGVTTNVPGPTRARYFAGTRLAGVLGWAPSAGDQTINECIFSFDGRIQVGFKADVDSVPDPQGLVRAFDEELASLISL